MREKKNDILYVRMRAAEKDFLRQRAEERDIALSQLAREIIRAWIKKETKNK